MTGKNCTKCGEYKLFSEFRKNKGGKHGLHSYCKFCSSKVSLEWAAENEERKKFTDRKWHQENKVRRNADAKQWQKDNADKQRQIEQEWYQANKARKAQSVKQWRVANHEKVRAKDAKRRAVKLNAIPPWFEKDLVELVYQKALEWDMEVDHVYPLQGKEVCGLHCWANLQLLDGPLNAKKGNRVWISE